MSDQQTDNSTQNIAQAIQEVSERASLLVREEIELAKVEVTEKITKLIKGAVVGIAAGIFAVFGLLFLLHGLAWLAWFELFPDWQFFWGFFVVAAVLFLLGALAGYIASRALKSGAPPVPTMAIDEAKLIRETVQSPHPEQTV
ncbi:MAG: phage holin family protein [Solirubrobacteraceae bacterium]